MKEETGASILFNPPWPQPLCSPDPLTLLTPIQLSFPLGPFLPLLSAQAPPFPELPDTSDLLPLPKLHRMRIRC